MRLEQGEHRVGDRRHVFGDQLDTIGSALTHGKTMDRATGARVDFVIVELLAGYEV
jgi:hypothetical protein